VESNKKLKCCGETTPKTAVFYGVKFWFTQKDHNAILYELINTRIAVKKFTLAFALLVSLNAQAFDLYALGTSNTNCKNNDSNFGFTATLEKLLRADGIDVRVINGGQDGDRPVFMARRVDGVIAAGTNKLVIYEGGPNERNPAFNREGSEVVLEKLQKAKVPAIYVSHRRIFSHEEAKESADKYGAYYYGHWADNVPVDRDHFMYDTSFGAGHMSLEGCQLWAKNMVPIVKRAIVENNIK
jgi:hypothetical protein